MTRFGEAHIGQLWTHISPCILPPSCQFCISALRPRWVNATLVLKTVECDCHSYMLFFLSAKYAVRLKLFYNSTIEYVYAAI